MRLLSALKYGGIEYFVSVLDLARVLPKSVADREQRESPPKYNIR